MLRKFASALTGSFQAIAKKVSRPQVLALFDFVAILFTSAFAYKMVEFALNLFGASYESWSRIVDERGSAFLLTSFLVVGWLYFKGSYHQRIPFWDASKNLVVACFFGLMVEGFVLYAYKGDVSRLLTFATWMLAPLMVMALRSMERAISHKRGVGIANVVIVGRGHFAANARRLLEGDVHLGFKVVAVEEPAFALDTPSFLAKYHDAAYVLVALSGSDDDENQVVAKLRAAEVDLILVPVPNGLVAGMEVRYFLGEESILLIDRMEVVPFLNRFAKRAFDVFVSGLMLAVAAIPMLIVAFFVRRDGGPATYSHERVGLDGKTFPCLKFRSMSVNADAMLKAYLEEAPERQAEWERSRKLKDDPRVTQVGKFLRKTTLDELPQLINVFKGQMSLVGPRPVTQAELEYYGSTAALYKSVRPGLTGLWQVSGRSDLNYDQRVRLDTWYVRNWTPWHDVAILLKTVPAVLFRRGAY